jgi:hypothetical protein
MTVFKKGKLVHSQNVVIDINREIQELEQGKMKEYLGITEKESIQHQQMKAGLKKKHTGQLRSTLKSDLNTENKTAAIVTLAVTLLRYSFGAIKWGLKETKN